MKNFIFNHTEYYEYRTTIIYIITFFVFINALVLAPDFFNIYSVHGLVDGNINDALLPKKFFTLNTLSSFFSKSGLNINYFLAIFLTVYLGTFVCILLNIYRFVFSFLALIMHSILINSSYSFTYGADNMISIALYVNALLCLIDIIKPKYKEMVFSAVIRLFQVQLCLVYFFSGVGKALGTDWFDGEAIWLVMNVYTSQSSWLDYLGFNFPQVFIFLSLFIMLLEIFYPLLVNISKIRKATVLAVILMHIGISLIIGLHTFAGIMILMNIVAYYPELIKIINEKIKKYGFVFKKYQF
ncbi:MAG: hypothetical protein LBE92_13665 [Chryseobacterium sp.]|uniref:hypothetical protein n=1 Tax=Chryseobacterium sp. TaxID=1871047 RepID=UPI00281EC113|nr:hypothetical protein [Chryseobacterium sp.]MDR2237164.1 hypothetical protein [Chryseobacterium sp.]